MSRIHASIGGLAAPIAGCCGLLLRPDLGGRMAVVAAGAILMAVSIGLAIACDAIAVGRGSRASETAAVAKTAALGATVGSVVLLAIVGAIRLLPGGPA